MKVNEAYREAFACGLRYLVLKGGAGSGKSVFTVQKLLTRILNEEGHRILVLRKVGKTLRGSVYQELQNVIASEGWTDLFSINKSEMRFTCLLNGNEVLLSGLDDPERIKSISGITSVWLEEATEFEEKDFSQIELRVRGATPNYKQFILSFNPIDENHWLKQRFFDAPDPDVLTVETTYKDNAFLDPEYIKHLTERVSSNENLHRIYVLNEWGRPNTGGEFYKCFRYTKHVTTCTYDPAVALHISFDFNVNPFMTLTVWQIKGKVAMQIDELCLPDPNNTTKKVCMEFVRRYQGHTAGLFVYGDPTGVQEDTRSEKGFNDYRIILNELAVFKPSLRVAKSAPPVVGRGNFINTVLESNFDGLQFLFSTTCKKTIEDYSYLKEAADGTKHKERGKDENNVTYEKFGHCTDANDYLLCQAFIREFDNYQRGNVGVKVTTGKVKSKHGY